VILRGLSYIRIAIFAVSKVVIKKPLILIWNLLFKYILTNLYKVYRSIKNSIISNPNFEKSKFRFLFVNKYVIYFVIAFIVILVTATNINAAGIRQENYGKQSIFYSLVSDEFNEYIVEEASQVTFEHGGESSRGFLDPSANVIAYSNIIDDSSVAADEYISATGLAYGSGVAPITSGTTSSERSDVIYHVVQGGETISEISDRYDVSTKTILWENEIGVKDYIKPGQTLTILPSSGVSHRIESGDTLASIAKEYEADEEKILEYNKLASADDLDVDDVLIIPGGQIEEIVPVTTYAATTGTSLRTNFAAPTSAAPSYATKLQWPTTSHKISQYYGWRHTGLDIDGETGDPLYAAEAGTVTAVGWNGGYGLRVVIAHAGGMQTLYAHSSQTYVTVGQAVSRGETIALQGNTGWSTGPHLHFEVIINGAKYNPLNYLR